MASLDHLTSEHLDLYARERRALDYLLRKRTAPRPLWQRLLGALGVTVVVL